MKTLPSRRGLLPRPTGNPWRAVVFLTIVCAACFLFFGPVGILILSAIVLGFGLLGRLTIAVGSPRLRLIAASRPDDSICTFARGFDCRRIDTAIIRAVYEELQDYFTFVTPSFPIRPTDNFESDLKLDPEDLEDIAKDIAFRTSRTLDASKANPYYERVHTVSDLVQFFSGQPSVIPPETNLPAVPKKPRADF